MWINLTWIQPYFVCVFNWFLCLGKALFLLRNPHSWMSSAAVHWSLGQEADRCDGWGQSSTYKQCLLNHLIARLGSMRVPSAVTNQYIFPLPFHRQLLFIILIIRPTEIKALSQKHSAKKLNNVQLFIFIFSWQKKQCATRDCFFYCVFGPLSLCGKFLYICLTNKNT